MKRLSIIALAASLALVGCATNRPDDAQMLAMYRAHAGAPVQSFTIFGHVSGWTPIGDSALAVWTRPKEAFLLELDGPCWDLEFTPFISLTSTFNRVSARFDKVLVRDRDVVSIPCRIHTIRPLDTTAIRAAEKTLRAQPVEPGGSSGT